MQAAIQRGEDFGLNEDEICFYDALAAAVLESDLNLRGFSSPDNNLESVFKYLVEA